MNDNKTLIPSQGFISALAAILGKYLGIIKSYSVFKNTNCAQGVIFIHKYVISNLSTELVDEVTFFTLKIAKKIDFIM